MKKQLMWLVLATAILVGCGKATTDNSGGQQATQSEFVCFEVTDESAPVVYFTKDISPEGLMKAYNALGWTPTGKVGVKISTGESEKTNHLRPSFSQCSIL